MTEEMKRKWFQWRTDPLEEEETKWNGLNDKEIIDDISIIGSYWLYCVLLLMCIITMTLMTEETPDSNDIIISQMTDQKPYYEGNIIQWLIQYWRTIDGQNDLTQWYCVLLTSNDSCEIVEDQY